EDGVGQRVAANPAREDGDRGANGGDGVIGQGGGKVGQAHAGFVGRRDIAERLRRATCQEIFDALRRRGVIATAEFEGVRFPTPLQRYAGQRAFAVSRVI